MKRDRSKDRLVWTGVSGLLVVVVLLLSLSSTALAQATDTQTREVLETLRRVFMMVQQNYVDESKTDPNVLLEGALKGLFETLDDPHSAYLSSDEMADLREVTVGEFGGVGLYILKTDAGVEVARPIPSTPAYRAGVQGGDVIIAVSGKPTFELTIDEVVDQLRGRPGTDVTMTIQRGESHVMDVTVTRAIIEIPTVRQAMINNETGYLLITNFSPKTAPQVRQALFQFEQDGYKSLIIDVRSNPGGLLSSVVDVSDFFFDRGTLIVSTRSRIPGESRVFKAQNRRTVPKDMPVAVLIDRYSASAAEILTGALKDTGRATILGEKSYGKGSVQQVVPIDTGAGFRLTTSRYYTPSDISIDKIGIEPDREVKFPEYTDEEVASLRLLIEGNRVQDFVQENADPDERTISEFITVLAQDGIVLREDRIRKNIRDEVNRQHNLSPVYDLEYDIVLQSAVDLLSK